MIWVVVIAVVVVALASVAAVRRSRSPHTSVDSFRRQIDALGPAARRTVVDQVQTAAARDNDDDDAHDDATTDDEPGSDAGEDGARGT